MNKCCSLLAVFAVLMNEGTCFTLSACSLTSRSECTSCDATEQVKGSPVDDDIQVIRSTDCCNHRLVAIGTQTEFLQEDEISASDSQALSLSRNIELPFTSGVGTYCNTLLLFENSPPPKENLPVVNSSLLI